MRILPELRSLALGAALSVFVAGSALGQTLTVAVDSGPRSLDPHRSVTPADREALKHIFETLVGTDARLQPEPALAVSWKVVDATTWEFKLREGVKFHDGSDFTAEDVKASVERASAGNEGQGSANPAGRIRETKVVDPHTIRILTDGPAPTLGQDLTRLFVVPAAAVQGLGREEASAAFNSGRAAIGTGPFRFGSWTSGKELVLERFGQHWRGASPWRTLIRKEIADASARIVQLKAGEVDVATRVPAEEILSVERDPKLRLVTAETPSIVALTFDFRDRSPRVTGKDGAPLPQNPLKDARVREALDLAIDRAALAEVSLEGLGKAVNQAVPPGLIGHNDKVPAAKPNLERARQLLAEAGYPDGFKAVLAFTTEDWPGAKAIGASLVRMLSRIGIEIEPRPEPAAVFVPALRGGDHALALLATGIDEAADGISALGRTRAPQGRGGTMNWGGYSNPDLDKLLDAAAAEFDDGKRRELLQSAGALFMKERVALPLVSLSTAWGLRRDRVELPSPRSDGATLAQDIVPAKR